ncbi:MAG TPA: glycoside hydrolase family 2 TIM barrel-domain containing protein [Bacteroidales bacterium]|nr:glycoside hydrolase family 2 TIM barrel-domain containing protein [Bacteroidales bacterium]
MKKLFLLFLIVSGCTSGSLMTREMLSISGVWKFRIDSLDAGLREKWYNADFTDSVRLPGSMAENGKGHEVTVSTQWTGEIVDRSYFTEKKYEKYRQTGNIKIPFWLKPVKYYKGVAWYSRYVEIDSTDRNKRYILFLERCHWQSRVFVNGSDAGTRISLSTPHEYDITALLKAGRNRISIRIDNSILIPVGVNSHSISDHTQTNWNGIIGEISLRMIPRLNISDVNIYPRLADMTAEVRIRIENNGPRYTGSVECRAGNGTVEKYRAVFDSGATIVKVRCHVPSEGGTWNEFNPSLAEIKASIKDAKGKLIDLKAVRFGMREFKAAGTRFEVNGVPVFLRGTTECCVFPLTGYPPADTASWMRIFRICKAYGLNHMRFHSYCPPEAAFDAADRLGFYLHVECASWANSGTSIGDSSSVDRFIYDESDRIVKYYGNHPSFCMLAYGNEPAGKNQEKYLGDLIRYWKSADNRRVYTSGAGWPVIPENDYNLTAEPRIQHWGEGLKSRINNEPVSTDFDFRNYVSKFKVPVVGHEIGQWCVYPDFSEIERYKGMLKPTNLEIFRETLVQNGLGDKAADFLKASGKLQVLCYKADIEAALRTPGFAGFEMLQLHDFPGQGTALVGILNPFFESKGYVTPVEFRMFCNDVVPLARMKKTVFSNDEKLTAGIEVANFSGKTLNRPEVDCELKDSQGNLLKKEVLKNESIPVGNCIPAGLFETDLSSVTKPGMLTLTVAISGTGFCNRWNIWVYPSGVKPDSGKVYITDRFDKKAESMLAHDMPVLLLTYKKILGSKGASVANGYSTIFWNTAWTGNQPPHTMGILCDPENNLFKDFPTEFHTDAEWWDIVTNSNVMILDGFPGKLDPLVAMIDTWFENRRLALLFESRTGGGNLMVCGIDLMGRGSLNPATKQFAAALLNYMNSSGFKPSVRVSAGQVRSLLKN